MLAWKLMAADTEGPPVSGESEAEKWAGSETDVVAICFDDPASPYGSMVIKDSVTTDNDFNAKASTGLTPVDKLNWTMTSPTMVRDANGLIKYANHNRLGNSQKFDQWSVVAATLTPNAATAPDGTQTAALLTDAAGSDRHICYSQVTVSGDIRRYGIQFRLKKGTFRYAQVQVADNSARRHGVVFDLQDGTITDTDTSGTVTNAGEAIQALADGWFLCTVYMDNPTTGGSSTIYPTVALSDSPEPNYTGDRNPVYIADGTGTILVWGGEVKSLPCQNPFIYVETPDANARYALPIQHDAAGNRLGLLVEEQRTNYLLYSTNWEQGVVTVDNTVVTPNFAIGPDGAMSASRIQMGETGYIYKQTDIIAETTYLNSVYLKVASGTLDLLLRCNNDTGGEATKTVTLTTAWQRFEVDPIALGSTDRCYFGFDARTLVGGDGLPKDFLAWHAQCEQGSFPTSPILTGSSQVTRAASQNRYLLAERFNVGDEASSLVLHGRVFGSPIYDYPLVIGLDGSGALRDNRHEFTLESSSWDRGDQYRGEYFEWDANQTSIFSHPFIEADAAYGSIQKLSCGADAVGSSGRRLLGAGAITDAEPGLAPVGTATALRFGKNAPVGTVVYSRIKHVPRRLSNAELTTEVE